MVDSGIDVVETRDELLIGIPLIGVDDAADNTISSMIRIDVVAQRPLRAPCRCLPAPMKYPKHNVFRIPGAIGCEMISMLFSGYLGREGVT